MNATDVVGYAYNAALHCTDCAAKQSMDKLGAIDGEGNPVHAVFCGEDSRDCWCDDCDASLDGDQS